jgi:hypothetical protein
MLGTTDNNQTNSIRAMKNLLGYLQVKPWGGLGAAFFMLDTHSQKAIFKKFKVLSSNFFGRFSLARISTKI